MAVLEIESEIAGKVWKIVTQIGQKLGEDDAILVLESMKMEIPIDAPEDGTLIELLVKEGDPVSEGQVVAKIEI